MNNRVEEYRRLARECIALSYTGVSSEARVLLLNMAQVWSRLVGEQGAALSEPAVQPVVLQQQQVQPKKEGE